MNPAAPPAPVADARALLAKGIQHANANQLDEAEACFRQAVALAPKSSDAHNALGVALARRKQFIQAHECFQFALAIGPESAELRNNLGNTLRDLDRAEESLPHYARALQMSPDYKDVFYNRGIALFKLRRFAEAVVDYTEALKREPDHHDCRMNRAFTFLHLGDWGRGWAEYEWRHKKHTLSKQPLVMPFWNGFDLHGRRLLILAEQGLGDSIQMIRFAPQLKAMGATVIFACPPKLSKLFERTPGIDLLHPQEQPFPPHDCYLPMMSLPGVMRVTPETVPASTPYINVDPALVSRWRAELDAIPGFKVGIHWQGNPAFPDDANRSIPLAMFEPLAKVPGVTLLSLQKFEGSDQLKTLNGAFPVIDLGARLDEAKGPFLDLAAVLMSLDLLITSDTAIVHLVGALGRPAWVALAREADWRWGLDRESTPWYPSLRLFRQEEHRKWPAVFARMARELAEKTRPRGQQATVAVPIGAGELIDKLTILEIKAARIADPEKLQNVRHELELLRDARQALPAAPVVGTLAAELKEVNAALWEVEDELRGCERRGEFGPRFVELARSVYQTNDRRAALKRRINEALGSAVVEEKSYGP